MCLSESIILSEEFDLTLHLQWELYYLLDNEESANVLLAAERNIAVPSPRSNLAPAMQKVVVENRQAA